MALADPLPRIPAGISLPGQAPQDWLSLAAYLTQLVTSLNQLLAQIATNLNALAPITLTGGPDSYAITVDLATGHLVTRGELGTQTTIGTP